MASRRNRSTATWVIAALGFTLPVSCLFGPENADGPCKEVGCDDGNPCTEDTCAEDGFCDHAESDAVPDDGNECTEDSCDGTKEKHAPKSDVGCGLGGALTCVDGECLCSAAAECGADGTCATFQCIGGVCKPTYAPDGTLEGPAEEDDCKKNVCDGVGGVSLVLDPEDFAQDETPGDCKKPACDETGTVLVAEPADVPVDDGNPCTIEDCNGDVPVVHEPVDDDTPCGPAASCTPAGAGFESLAQPVCAAGTCGATSPVSCGLYTCNGSNTACRSDCSTDAHCTSNAYCGGSTCAAKLPDGDNCAGNNQCSSGHCVDGVCCNTECAGTCFACDLLLGTCLPMLPGTDIDNECPGTLACNGVLGCEKPTGETCAVDNECETGACEDGYCCNSDCAGSCRRCDLPSSLGTCSNVPAGQQAGFCVDPGEQCDGAGNCKVTNGTPCGGNDDCLSGFCSDEPAGENVCCNEACGGTCRSCRQEKTGQQTGICGFIPDKADPDGECSGPCMNNGNGCCNGDGTCQP